MLSSNISSTRPTIWRTSAHYRLRSVPEFGAPLQISTCFSSCLRYCSDVAHRAPTKLFAMFSCLLGWYTIYTFSGALALTEFCQVQNSLYIQVLCSPILTVLQHGTRVVGVSQTLRCVSRNEIMELSQRAPSIFRGPAITLGIGPHSSYSRLV